METWITVAACAVVAGVLLQFFYRIDDKKRALENSEREFARKETQFEKYREEETSTIERRLAEVEVIAKERQQDSLGSQRLMRITLPKSMTALPDGWRSSQIQLGDLLSKYETWAGTFGGLSKSAGSFTT